jgi:hypothetical protein
MVKSEAQKLTSTNILGPSSRLQHTPYIRVSAALDSAATGRTCLFLICRAACASLNTCATIPFVAVS